MDKKTIGMNGEQAAAAFLKNKGYKIIQPNYRVAGAEVDLVASIGDILCFVEVKTRKSSDFGAPEAFVTRPKQLKIIRAARFFRPASPIAISACASTWSRCCADDDDLVCDHLENAFEE